MDPMKLGREFCRCPEVLHPLFPIMTPAFKFGQDATECQGTARINAIRSLELQMHSYYGNNIPTIRLEILMWLWKVCVTFEYNVSVHHTAIYYFDIYLDRINKGFSRRRLYLIAGASLVVAASHDPLSAKPLTYESIRPYLLRKCTTELLAKAHSDLINELEMHLTVPTPVHYMEIFGVLFPHSHTLMPIVACSLQCKENTIGLVNRLLADVSTDINLMHGRPSELAAAILMSIRIISHADFIWTPELAELTGMDINISVWNYVKRIIKNEEIVCRKHPQCQKIHTLIYGKNLMEEDDLGSV